MNRAHKFRRLGKRNGFAAGVVILLLLCIAAVFFLRPGKSVSLRRVNIVVASSPISVWSWDTLDNTFAVVSLPSEIVIDAVHGYGKYSLEAIWKLGFIEKPDASILSESLSDALGTVVPWYVGSTSQELAESTHPVAFGRELFSWMHVTGVLFGHYHTNIPPALFLSFSRALAGARADAIAFIDLSEKSVTRQEELPDNTKRNVLDPELLDVALKSVFEDDLIRKEGVSVAVYNTTKTPALGNRAARLLTSSGVLVIFVGNEEGEVSTCQLEGDTKALASKTASVIAEILDCRKVQATDMKRTDLTVRVGVNYAKQFVSRAAPAP